MNDHSTFETFSILVPFTELLATGFWLAGRYSVRSIFDGVGVVARATVLLCHCFSVYCYRC